MNETIKVILFTAGFIFTISIAYAIGYISGNNMYETVKPAKQSKAEARICTSTKMI